MSVTYIGIDIAKDKADACFIDDSEQVVKSQSYPQEKFAALVKNVAKAKPRIIVLEATGGYERPLALLLAKKGLPFAILNPARIRQFAKAIGYLCKTDAVDARLLALYAKRNAVEPASMPSEKQHELRQLFERRRQLVEMRAMEKVRAQQTSHKAAADSIGTVITHLTDQIAEIDRLLDAFIDDDPELRTREELLASVPGVGTTTARSLMAQLPELGEANRQEIAALAGLAPYPHESGHFRGRSMIRGGRKGARTALYMATVSAIRFNERIRRFYERLRLSGKHAKVAVTACMRKLLVQLNAVLKKKEPYKI